MKLIHAYDLVPGDIFAKEIKLHGRVAYEVIEKPENANYIIITERGDFTKKQTKTTFHENAKVYLLRNINQ